MQIAIIILKKNYVEINIFVTNINIDDQNNFNYIKDDFFNKERENRENDREDFNFN